MITEPSSMRCRLTRSRLPPCRCSSGTTRWPCHSRFACPRFGPSRVAVFAFSRQPKSLFVSAIVSLSPMLWSITCPWPFDPSLKAFFSRSS